MKIPIFSDLHLHTWKSFGLGEQFGMTRRLEEQVDILNQIRKVMIDINAQFYIFGGDLFHKDSELPVECVNIASRFFNKLNIGCVKVTGQHDLINKSAPTWFQNSLNMFNDTNNSSCWVGDIKI